jgi:hypothetical protein
VYVHYESTHPLHAVVRPPVLCHILLYHGGPRHAQVVDRCLEISPNFQKISYVGSHPNPQPTTHQQGGTPTKRRRAHTSVVLGVHTTAARDSAWRSVSSPARSWERREPGDIQAQRAALPTRTVRVSTWTPHRQFAFCQQRTAFQSHPSVLHRLRVAVALLRVGANEHVATLANIVTGIIRLRGRSARVDVTWARRTQYTPTSQHCILPLPTKSVTVDWHTRPTCAFPEPTFKNGRCRRCLCCCRRRWISCARVRMANDELADEGAVGDVHTRVHGCDGWPCSVGHGRSSSPSRAHSRHRFERRFHTALGTCSKCFPLSTMATSRAHLLGSVCCCCCHTQAHATCTSRCSS